MKPWPPSKKERTVSPVKNKRKALDLTKVEQLRRKMGIGKKSSKSRSTISMAGLPERANKLKTKIGFGSQRILRSLKTTTDLQRTRVFKFIKSLKPLGELKRKKTKGKLRINALFVRYAAIGAGIIIGVSLITGAALHKNNTRQVPIPVFSVVFDGQIVGYVRDISPIETSIRRFREELEQDYKMDVVFTQPVEYLATAVNMDQLTDAGTINKQLKAALDVKVNAVAIVIDGREAVVVKNKAVAQSIIEEIKAPYKDVSKDAQLKDLTLAEDVQFEDKLVPYGHIEDKETAYKVIAVGTEEQKTYEIQEGDSLWSIVKRHKITLDEIMAANPGLGEDDTIKPGDELNLVVPKNLINVVTKEVATYTKNIPYETKTENDGSMYTTQSKIVTEGREGNKEVVVEVTRLNGVEQQRVVMSEKVLKEPVDKVVAKGTKKPPPSVGTGSFSLPTRGTITSRFGMRWGRLHTGVDIGAPTGTPIRASDSGKVIFTGWSGGYGKLVKIDHGGGKVTYYAHCSSINVSRGQNVSKGQVIARVGSTGNSTGPHLHFEIRINGKPVNPLGRAR